MLHTKQFFPMSVSLLDLKYKYIKIISTIYIYNQDNTKMFFVKQPVAPTKTSVESIEIYYLRIDSQGQGGYNFYCYTKMYAINNPQNISVLVLQDFSKIFPKTHQ